MFDMNIYFNTNELMGVNLLSINIEKNTFDISVKPLMSFIIFTISGIYLNYKNNKVNVSIFNDQKINQINSDDFDYALSETSSEMILYVSYTGSSEIRNIEDRLYKEIEKKNLTDKIIYWNVTNSKNSEYINTLRKRFPEIKDQINTAPLFIYIKDGKGVEAMSSELKKVYYKVFNKLVSKYNIE